MQIIKKIQILEVIIAVLLVLIGVSMRLIPHLPNFTPIAAIALFAGVYLSKRTALILPVAAIVISDIFIGYYEISLMAVVYGSFLLCVLLGFWLKKTQEVANGFGEFYFSRGHLLFLDKLCRLGFHSLVHKNFLGNSPVLYNGHTFF